MSTPFHRWPVAAKRRLAEEYIHALIDLLDDLDPDPDLEPSFGFLPRGAPDEGEPDDDGEATIGWCEGSLGHLNTDYEDGENEPSLGWAENVGQLRLRASDELEVTSTETHGRGFIRSGPDDSEDSHDAEAFADVDGLDDQDGAAVHLVGRRHREVAI